MKRVPRTAAGRVIECVITEHWSVQVFNKPELSGKDDGGLSQLNINVRKYGQYKGEPDLTDDEKTEIRKNFSHWLQEATKERWETFSKIVISEKVEKEEASES